MHFISLTSNLIFYKYFWEKNLPYLISLFISPSTYKRTITQTQTDHFNILSNSRKRVYTKRTSRLNEVVFSLCIIPNNVHMSS